MALFTPINWWFRAMSFTTLPKELSNRIKFSNKPKSVSSRKRLQWFYPRRQFLHLLCSNAFPFVEMLILVRNATNAAFNTVAQYNKSIVVEEFRNYIFVIGKIIVVGILICDGLLLTSMNINGMPFTNPIISGLRSRLLCLESTIGEQLKSCCCPALSKSKTLSVLFLSVPFFSLIKSTGIPFLKVDAFHNWFRLTTWWCFSMSFS